MNILKGRGFNIIPGPEFIYQTAGTLNTEQYIVKYKQNFNFQTLK